MVSCRATLAATIRKTMFLFYISDKKTSSTARCVFFVGTVIACWGCSFFLWRVNSLSSLISRRLGEYCKATKNCRTLRIYLGTIDEQNRSLNRSLLVSLPNDQFVFEAPQWAVTVCYVVSDVRGSTWKTGSRLHPCEDEIWNKLTYWVDDISITVLE